MPAIPNFLPRACFAAGIALLILGTYMKLAEPTSPTPGIETDDLEQEVTGLEPGQRRELTFTFRNTGRRPVRAYGIAFC